MAKPLEGSFEAVLNKQPIQPPSIRVTGEVEVNSGGWTGTLVRPPRPGRKAPTREFSSSICT